MPCIQSIKAAQRLDSRGNPTVQVTMITEKGMFRSLVPSGASKGDYEAIELRDGDNGAYYGKGVMNAVKNVNNVLGPAILKKDFKLPGDVSAIDKFMIELDRTNNKSNLGANSILGISMAAYRAAAAYKGVPLYEFIRQYAGVREPYMMPVPFFNVLNGGVHSGNTMAFQEFMIAPVGARSLTDAVRMGAEVYQELKSVITKKFGPSATGVGDEGGFAPPITHPHEALDLLTTAIRNCNYESQVKIGIDPASSEFFNPENDHYELDFKIAPNMRDPSMNLSRNALSDLYHSLLARYPIILLEDPFAQDDWPSWQRFAHHCPIELVGDDLLATNKERIAMAHERHACNSLLLKINQIGTITEAIDAAKQAFGYGWSVFVSHRSGETTDDFIADLCTGLGTGHLKAGSPCRGERVAKYNRLMDIEEELGGKEKELAFGGVRYRDEAVHV